MEAKQYAAKQPMDHWRNQRGNLKTPRDKWQWKHNNPNLSDTAEAVLKGKFTVIQAYHRKQEKSQTNNLTLHPKELEKEQSSKLVKF